MCSLCLFNDLLILNFVIKVQGLTHTCTKGKKGCQFFTKHPIIVNK